VPAKRTSDASADAASGGLRLTYVGHATLLVELDGVRLLTDPLLRGHMGPLVRYAPPVDLESLRGVDAVLISHAHVDHLDVRSLRLLDTSARLVVARGCGRVVRRLGFAAVEELDEEDTTTVGRLTIEATPAEHPGKRYPAGRGGVSLGLVARGSRSIYFAGDTGLFPEMTRIGPHLDIACLPVSGWGPTLPDEDHLSPLNAAKALQLLRPHLAIPVHWGTYAPPYVSRLWKNGGAQPPEAFVRYAHVLAPDVHVRVLGPGESLRLDGAAG